MIKYMNEANKECYKDVDTDTPFSRDLFHEVDMSWSDTDEQKAFHSNLGTLTVLDRMTGYGNGIRDIETGYRNPSGDFWLASCDRDVLESGAKTVGEAIQWVKKHANNCDPDRNKS
jgi:hypothetical protein